MKLTLAARLAIAKLVRLLASDRDGEVVAAARALGRTLKTSGYDFHDLARALALEVPPSTTPNDGRTRTGFRADPVETEPSWEQMVDACIDEPERFTAREQEFLESMQSWRGEPTEKQFSWLSALYRRVA